MYEWISASIMIMIGAKTSVEDPYLTEARNWGYQSLQIHQQAVVDSVATLLSLETVEHSVSSTVGSVVAIDNHDNRVLGAMKALLDTIPDEERRQLVLTKLAS